MQEGSYIASASRHLESIKDVTKTLNYSDMETKMSLLYGASQSHSRVTLEKQKLLEEINKRCDGKALLGGRKSKLQLSNERLQAAVERRERLERKLHRASENVALMKDWVVTKKQILTKEINSLHILEGNLEQEFEALHRSTSDRLNIVQHSLTYRRWQLASGLVDIFSLNAKEDSFSSPNSSPLRAGRQKELQYLDGSSTIRRNISICGLELDSNVIRKNTDTMLEKEREMGGHLVKLASILGYVAHILQLLSKYFDIPLRYPIKAMTSRCDIQRFRQLDHFSYGFLSCRSSICDMVPSKDNNEVSESLLGREIKFPLYIDHAGVERERTR